MSIRIYRATSFLTGFFSIALMAALTFGPSSSQAQTPVTPKKPAPAVAAPAKSPDGPAAAEKKARPIPFRGTLVSVNTSARTLTVSKREFQLTAQTKIYKEDKNTQGTLKDARVGWPVTGSYVKGADGKLLAGSVYFKSPKTSPATNAPASTAGVR